MMTEPTPASVVSASNNKNWRWGQINFFPSIIVILTFYYFGIAGFLELFQKMIEARGQIDANGNIAKPNEVTVIYLKQLFYLGLLGGAMHCSMFLAKDFNCYHAEKQFSNAPMILDFTGYIMQIIGGGITGVLLIFALKTGLVVVTTGSYDEVTDVPNVLIPYSEWFVAFAGGMGTHHVKALLDTFLRKTTGAKGKIGGGHDQKEADKPTSGTK
tara:strand:- start:58 stop:699 length:642 start_codon:yes stop_codon:yes gene_type:complete